LLIPTRRSPSDTSIGSQGTSITGAYIGSNWIEHSKEIVHPTTPPISTTETIPKDVRILPDDFHIRRSPYELTKLKRRPFSDNVLDALIDHMETVQLVDIQRMARGMIGRRRCLALRGRAKEQPPVPTHNTRPIDTSSPYGRLRNEHRELTIVRFEHSQRPIDDLSHLGTPLEVSMEIEESMSYLDAILEYIEYGPAGAVITIQRLARGMLGRLTGARLRKEKTVSGWNAYQLYMRRYRTSILVSIYSKATRRSGGIAGIQYRRLPRQSSHYSLGLGSEGAIMWIFVGISNSGFIPRFVVPCYWLTHETRDRDKIPRTCGLGGNSSVCRNRTHCQIAPM
jgi:hypothetical protein